MSNETSSGRSVEYLTLLFDREIKVDMRAAAETAYVLAFHYRNCDIEGRRRFDLAKRWAITAIDLLDSLPSDGLSQVVSTRTSIEGFSIPGLLHSGVVRERLADVLA